MTHKTMQKRFSNWPYQNRKRNYDTLSHASQNRSQPVVVNGYMHMKWLDIEKAPKTATQGSINQMSEQTCCDENCTALQQRWHEYNNLHIVMYLHVTLTAFLYFIYVSVYIYIRYLEAAYVWITILTACCAKANEGTTGDVQQPANGTRQLERFRRRRPKRRLYVDGCSTIISPFWWICRNDHKKTALKQAPQNKNQQKQIWQSICMAGGQKYVSK